jgi:hypothetical protein
MNAARARSLGRRTEAGRHSPSASIPVSASAHPPLCRTHPRGATPATPILARRLVAILALAAALLCWGACERAGAAATFTPFELATGDPAHGLQAEYAYEPAISANGAYVAFTGVVASKPGVYRKDLATGELATVAFGSGTGAPSISADGRYVSFTTSEDPLTGAPTADGCTEVYRRDMDAEEAAPTAFALASALSGPSEEPLTYAGSGKAGCPGGGSASAGRVALSADGSELAFTVIGSSNLTAAPTEPPGATPTPPEQVAVHNFGTDTTTLVSVTLSSLGGAPQPVPGGATLSGSPLLEGVPRKGEGGNIELGQDASTAAISADGSTVAWMGIDIAAQAPAGNLPHVGEYLDSYAEPLWRQITEGPAAPTRRVLAGDDPSAPSCPPSCSGGLDLEWGEEFLDTTNYKGAGPAFGSYIANAEQGFKSVYAVTPQLSADGMQVALLSTQPTYEHLPNLAGQKDLKGKPPTANAFVVDMAPGLTREQAITRLTEWASPDFSNAELDGTIGQLAISADGSRVALTTERVVFPLAPPALVTPPVNQAQTLQLYEANLQAGTLALVSQGYNGEPANYEEDRGGVSAAALSADGRVLALASGSSNLAFGAVNEGSDVFVTEELDQPVIAGVQSVTTLPPGPTGEAGWSISATARSSDGALLIDVAVPGAGRLTASASASVPSTATVSGHPGKGARRPRASTVHGTGAAAAKAHALTVIATRQVASAASTAPGGGLVQLRLTPSSRYRSLVDGKGSLYATIAVTFAAPGHPLLTQTLQASFPRPAGAHRAATRQRRKRKSSSTHRGARG